MKKPVTYKKHKQESGILAGYLEIIDFNRTRNFEVFLGGRG